MWRLKRPLPAGSVSEAVSASSAPQSSHRSSARSWCGQVSHLWEAFCLLLPPWPAFCLPSTYDSLRRARGMQKLGVGWGYFGSRQRCRKVHPGCRSRWTEVSLLWPALSVLFFRITGYIYKKSWLVRKGWLQVESQLYVALGEVTCWQQCSSLSGRRHNVVCGIRDMTSTL